jgi:hypothetical protein
MITKETASSFSLSMPTGNFKRIILFRRNIFQICCLYSEKQLTKQQD